MIYSYSQITQYLACPRSYRHRYLDGWREKETRAAMVFGRAFEQALAAYFRRQDPTAALFDAWAPYRDQQLEYSRGNTWDSMVQQGVLLLNRFAQDDRISVPQPDTQLQAKIVRTLGDGRDFVAYVDALGKFDGQDCLIEWKTTSSRLPEEPVGLLALDSQLICYSWLTGISEVAMVVFVRKRMPEIQYLRTTISDQQREDFGRLATQTLEQIEAASFLPHTGIRFPHNGCVSCSHLGLCLDQPELVAARLVRRQGGADLDWLDQLDY